jgi:dihydroorotate dehydrogenase
VNLGKNKSSAPDSISDFISGVRTFGPIADVLVINVSSPNTPGLRGLQGRGMVEELLNAVVQERNALKPRSDSRMKWAQPKIVLKIAPDLSDKELAPIAAAIRESGIDGVIVSNTTVKRPAGLKSGLLLLPPL